MELLKGKIAIVTGAARGIGRATCEVYAEQGADVMMVDIAGDAVQDAAREIAKETGRKVLGRPLDVTQKAQVEALVQVTVQELGGVDILVNSAGILRPNLVINIPEEDWDAVYAVNVKGTFLCSQAVAKVMIQQGRGGSIVLMSSASGKKPDMEGGAYCSSKSAIIGLMRVLALELGQYQIRANAILPGATDTEMLRGLFVKVPDLKDLLAARTPLGKMATPRDQANAALFLASDLASHITGEQLVVSGGEFMSG
jgi:NAD(P)-dependent dehydrogenase (short-subunit alcohol dehydrogenase family)